MDRPKNSWNLPGDRMNPIVENYKHQVQRKADTQLRISSSEIPGCSPWLWATRLLSSYPKRLPCALLWQDSGLLRKDSGKVRNIIWNQKINENLELHHLPSFPYLATGTLATSLQSPGRRLEDSTQKWPRKKWATWRQWKMPWTAAHPEAKAEETQVQD